MAPIVQTPPAIPCDQRAAQWGQLLYRFKSELTITSTVKSRVEARVTIQKIKSLGVLQFEFYVVKGGATNQDMSLTETC